jgi:hypothetical protein
VETGSLQFEVSLGKKVSKTSSQQTKPDLEVRVYNPNHTIQETYIEELDLKPALREKAKDLT